ncbi:MAG: hypothetical protein RMK64_04520 [Rhodovarius sp.]|nr:hypothetical protein [Rhodovarius sp.]MCX7933070.1 hypothetical protein [Rhodovarius sp.]MDW8314214.1 hypothetical protein [Rhodovarius sp.]
MTSLTDHARNLLARTLCGRAPAQPTAVFCALGTGGSPSTGLTGEPVGNGYARQRVTFTGTGTQSNAEAIRFTFTGPVGTLTHIGLFDAAAGGNPLTWGPLSSAVSVTGPGTATINPGGLTISGS